MYSSSGKRGSKSAWEGGVAREPNLKLAGFSLWVRSSDDDGWLILLAQAEASGAFVEVAGPWLQIDDIERFSEQLDGIEHDLVGEAHLVSLEPAIDVKVICRRLGHAQVVVSITPDFLNQSHKFTFDIDQTYFGPAARSCRQLLDGLASRRTQGVRRR